jgi:polar amino acid transport system substrate-binding protein
MKKLLVLMLAIVMVFACFAGCGAEKAKVVVAEKESAGEEVAQTLEGYTYTAVDTQAKALMEVSSGTADAAIVDYVMSIGSIGEGTDYENLKVEGTGFNEENYGIAFRKGSDLTSKVNEAIKTL